MDTGFETGEGFELAEEAEVVAVAAVDDSYQVKVEEMRLKEELAKCLYAYFHCVLKRNHECFSVDFSSAYTEKMLDQLTIVSE